MKCRFDKNKIIDLVESDFSSDSKDEIMQHIKECSECMNFYNSLRGLKKFYEYEPSVSDSELIESIKQNVDKDIYSKKPIKILSSFYRHHAVIKAAAIAAAAFVVVYIGFSNSQLITDKIASSEKYKSMSSKHLEETPKPQETQKPQETMPPVNINLNHIAETTESGNYDVVSPEVVNTALNIDIKELIKNDYMESLIESGYNLDTVYLREFKKIDLSTSQGVEDYYLTAYLYGQSGRQNMCDAFFILSFDGKTTSVKLANFSSKSKFALYDLDGDGINEVILENSTAYTKGEEVDVKIYKCINDKFELIFDEFTKKYQYPSPFSCKNTVEFVRNVDNPKLIDIKYTLNFEFDSAFYNKVLTDDQYNDEIKEYCKNCVEFSENNPIPQNETVVFELSSGKYEPSSPMVDYRKYF